MFQAGKPVTGGDFIGRQKEIELINQYLSMGQSIVLIAPRRFGKTSLVHKIIKNQKERGTYTSFIDVFSCPNITMFSEAITAEVLQNHNLKNAFTKVKYSALEMIKNVKLKSVIEDFEFLVGYAEAKPDGWHLLQKSIGFIDQFANKHGKAMICAMDEIGDVSKYDKHEEVIKMLRSEIQNQKASTYIFSGSYESVMNAMFVSDKSPFYRMARIIKLGYLSFDDLMPYMVGKLKEQKMKVDEKLLEDTIDFLKGHPYYCQLALQQIFLFKIIRKKNPTLDQVLTELAAAEKSYLEKLWEDYSGNKEYSFVLRNLVYQPRGIFGKSTRNKVNATRALKKLEGSGIIYREGKGHYFYDPMFEYFIDRSIK